MKTRSERPNVMFTSRASKHGKLLRCAVREEETHIIFSFFYISQKNSAKAKETSGGWLKVFSETPQNASMLLHFATALHKKKNMFSMEPK